MFVELSVGRNVVLYVSNDGKVKTTQDEMHSLFGFLGLGAFLLVLPSFLTGNWSMWQRLLGFLGRKSSIKR